MSKTDPQIFLEHVTELMGGPEDIIRPVGERAPGLPPIATFIWRDRPETGMITGITFGLSIVPHPEWRLARPELIVCMESKDESWPLAAASFANSFRGDKVFSFGDLFTLDTPISDESAMSAFFVFAPAIGEREQHRIELSRYAVHLVQMYPLYPGEVSLYQKIGLEKFWNLDSFDPLDPRRRDLSRG
jgi:hypothetical protein